MLCSKCSKDFNTLHTKQILCPKCAGFVPMDISREKEAKIKKVLSKALVKIKPSADERATRLVQIAIFCKNLLDGLGNEATITLGGSMGKDTNLR